MKIRLGFVSNSSNTSFCIYGKYFDNLSEELQSKIEETGLDLINGQDEGYYVGRNYTSIKDNETGKQFKDSVFKELQKIFPDITEESLRSIEDGWYDG